MLRETHSSGDETQTVVEDADNQKGLSFTIISVQLAYNSVQVCINDVIELNIYRQLFSGLNEIFDLIFRKCSSND